MLASTLFSALLLPAVTFAAIIPPMEPKHLISRDGNVTTIDFGPNEPFKIKMQPINGLPDPQGVQATSLATSPNPGISLLSATWQPYCYTSGVVEWGERLKSAIDRGCYWMDKELHWKVPKGYRWSVVYEGTRYPDKIDIEVGYQNISGSEDGWEVKEDECKTWLHAVLPVCWYKMHCCCCYWTYESQGGWYTTSSGYAFVDPNAA